MSRLFFALPVPIEIRNQIIAALPAERFPGVRVISTESLHITAHFLGEQKAGDVPTIISKADTIFETMVSFSLALETTEVICKKHVPQMLCVRMKPEPSFEHLCLQLRNAFPTEEKRNPVPHITLARFRQIKKLPFPLPHLRAFTFLVKHVELWQSILEPNGAVYSCLHEFPLAPLSD